MSRRLLTAVVALALLAAPPPIAAQEAASESARRRALGLDAAKAGDHDAARHHLLAAVALDPAALGVFADLATLDVKDVELRRLWAFAAARAAADANGKVTPPATWPKEGRTELTDAADVMRLRAKAAKVASGAAGRLKGAVHDPTRQWLQGLARTLADGTPAISLAREPEFERAAARTAPDIRKVQAALEALMQKAYGDGDLDTALEAARTLRGLHQQDGQTKTNPAPPSADLFRVLAMIRKIRDDLRKAEAARGAEDGAQEGAEPVVWTVEQLEAVPEEEIDAWNARHTKWSAAGVAESPKQRYRVETICGLATLHGVTADVELHHARLVDWYGKDPFLERQGLVRLCPSYRDFESEGQPYWWAGGFQAGDVTTMIARFANRTSLGKTLTHELTHRFDGALFPGMPAWLVEGRAVYTETGSLSAASPQVDDRVFSPGRLWETGSKGYGRPAGLRKLLTGKIDDYRHNYDAGYALFLFLMRYSGFDAEQAGKPLFKGRVPAFLTSFRTKPRDAPERRFVAHFADGKDGRPESLEAFAALFQRFVGEGGSGAQPGAPWRQTWMKQRRTAIKTGKRKSRPGRETIYDAPTFQPGRSRHDPPDHGQYHALAAAQLLLAAGQRDAALEAHHWALRADEPTASDFLSAAGLATAAGRKDVAWVEHLLASRMEALGPPRGELGGPAAPAWRAARGVATAYASRAEAALAAQEWRVARAFRAEHDAVAEWLAIPPLGALPGETGMGIDDSAVRAPELVPARSLLLTDLVEERWAPLDSEPGGPWHAPGPEAVELGRRTSGKEVTGQVRDAHERRVFVRSNDWLSGTYTVQTRIRFLSAFANARLIVGKTHRDRGLEVRVGGGDWQFAVGNRKEGTPLRSISLSVSDLRPYGTRTSPLNDQVTFASPREAFTVTVHVSGSFARVLVDGVERVSFRRETGQPIEGQVGFGLSRGIVRFEEPVTRRHRVLGTDRVSPEERFDEPLDLGRPGTFPWDTVVGRRVVGVPSHPTGTLLLWYPGSAAKSEYDAERMGLMRDVLTRWVRRQGFPLVTRIAVPQSAPETLTELDDVPILRHHGHADVTEAIARSTSDKGEGIVYRGYPAIPVWLMLDAQNVVRSAGPRSPLSSARVLAHALAGR